MNSSQHGYVDDIEDEIDKNKNFRKILFTGPNMQLVVMLLQPGEDIGMEVHKDHDQFIKFESGSAKVILNGEETDVHEGFGVVVPAGVEHNVINVSQSETLKLYTLYAPPEHPEGTIQKEKPE